MARDERIVVRIRTDVKDEFSRYADMYGMTVSTLGSYVIGKWVANQKLMQPALQRMQDMVFEGLSHDMSLSRSMIENVLKEIMPQIMSKIVEDRD